VLGRLLDEYAEEFPDRAEERRKMLARLAESAEDGILSPDLDGVIHTLFYDLLRRGLKPSKQFWKRENSTPKPRKPSKAKGAAARRRKRSSPRPSSKPRKRRRPSGRKTSDARAARRPSARRGAGRSARRPRRNRRLPRSRR